MKIDVSAGMAGINFSPQSTVEEVIQNVRCILSTRKGSVPFDRAFGVSWDMLDRPLPVAKAMMIAAVVEAVQEYEPRAEVRGVKFNADGGAAMEGVLDPVVTIEINEGKASTSRRHAASATSAPKAEANAETEAVTTSDVSIITQKAEQAIAAAKAATAALASLEPRLHDIESADYSSIYDQG